MLIGCSKTPTDKYGTLVWGDDASVNCSFHVNGTLVWYQYQQNNQPWTYYPGTKFVGLPTGNWSKLINPPNFNSYQPVEFQSNKVEIKNDQPNLIEATSNTTSKISDTTYSTSINTVKLGDIVTDDKGNLGIVVKVDPHKIVVNRK